MMAEVVAGAVALLVPAVMAVMTKMAMRMAAVSGGGVMVEEGMATAMALVMPGGIQVVIAMVMK